MEALFWLLTALVAWCYAGYPASMILRARLRPLPPANGEADGGPVSIVLVARDEAGRMEGRLRDLLAQEGVGEVVAVCNGCVDSTEAVARAMAREDGRVRVVCAPAGRGKAAGVSAGVAAARHATIVFADARQRFAPGAVRNLIAPFADPRVGAVTGRLRIGGAAGAVEGVRLYWGMETALRMAEGRTGSVVGATGAIYAVRRALFRPLPPDLILDDVLVPMRIAMRGFRVVMAADAVAFDEPSGDPAAEYRRKRRTMLGNLQLLRVCPALLLPWRNPLWARFVSHKLLRVASPACFVGMLATAAFLPGPIYRAAFLGLAAIYVAGIAGLVVRWRPLAVPAAFVLMHGAVFSAFRNLGRGAAEVWTPRPADAAGRG